jgi:hypothetical protein
MRNKSSSLDYMVAVAFRNNTNSFVDLSSDNPMLVIRIRLRYVIKSQALKASNIDHLIVL